MPTRGEPRIAVPPVDPSSLADWDSAAQVCVLSGATMGTTWQVRAAVPVAFDAAPLHAAIVARLDGIVAQMSHWEAASLLSRFNAAAAGTWTALPADFATVIDAAIGVADASDGAFDPAAGSLVDLWGFGATPVAGAPDEAAIAAALAVSGWRRLVWDAPAARLRQPGGCRLDLSGIAKGHAVDAIADLLAERGLHHALVDVGGELAGRGLRPDGDPWWVDLETPTAGVPPLRIALHQCAVATSGDYIRGRHTIDPRDGRPVADTLSVSVIHEKAMLADAWATALSVVSVAEMRRLATAHRLAVRALRREGGGVTEWISDALSRMMNG